MATSNNSSNVWEHTMAFKHRADCARSNEEGRVEINEDAGPVEIDEIAEVLVECGVERKLAARAAERVFARQAKRDGELAREVGGALGAPAVFGADAQHKATAAESVRMMAIKLVQSPKPRFSAGCLLVAMGEKTMGDFISARTWAERQNVSPEHTSNEVEEWGRMLNLPPTSERKTDAHRKIYRDTNGRQSRAKT